MAKGEKESFAVEPTCLTILGAQRPIELVEVSFGCTEHTAPLCTLLRLLDSGELVHLPGGMISIEQTNEPASVRITPVDAQPATKVTPPFPPQAIRHWANGGYVMTEELLAEFRAWIGYLSS